MSATAIATAEPPDISQIPEHWPLRYVLPPVAALPTAAKMARAHVRDVLGEWGLHHFEDNAILITSELVANVVQQCHDHNGIPVYVNDRMPLLQLSLFSNREHLLITVWDQAPGTPAEQHADDDAETGRGLEIIGRLSTWDWYPVQGGKIVRALLAAAA